MTASSSDKRQPGLLAEETPIEALSFDELLDRLEEVVQQLETDELSLDASIDAFERGVKLAARCQGMLSDAELRISQITNEIGETAPYAAYDARLNDDEEL